MTDLEFETTSVTMTPVILLIFQAPAEDVDRIISAVTTITPLTIGNYDSNCYQTAHGVERYRPMRGAAAGEEAGVRQRPGTVEVSFELPRDLDLVQRVIETIFQTHCYQEPIIRIIPILSSRSKGLDDKNNPNRWWNSTGDWIAPKNNTAGVDANR